MTGVSLPFADRGQFGSLLPEREDLEALPDETVSQGRLEHGSKRPRNFTG